MSGWASRRALFSWVVVAVVVLLSGCDWTMTRYGPAQTGFDPFETTIGVSNVASVHSAWSAPIPVGEPHGLVVANGVLFVGTDTSVAPLYAFDAKGSAGCSGTPTTCVPLWMSTVNVAGTAEVAGGRVYVPAGPTLYAFDASGVTGCAGTPKTCAPLWSYSDAGVTIGQPVIVNGLVYAGTSTGGLVVFDAAGSTGCSGTPKVCAPLWIGQTGGAGSTSSPAVVGGVAYVSASGSPTTGYLFAFDATGTRGCSGTPKTCAPLWQAHGQFGPPTVSNGYVYVGSGPTQTFSVFDASGTTNCTETPKTCTPLWTNPTGQTLSLSFPAVANGKMYVNAGGTLETFDAFGHTNCSGTPRTCTALWTATAAFGSSPIVANGVVYVSGPSGITDAFDAAATAGCSGTPKTCTPLASINVTGFPSPIIANGVIYGSTGRTIEALTP
jgi:hypothetical protein